MGHKSNQQLANRVAALPRPTTSWQKWIVTGGGVGFLRPAPGSWGTCPPALLFFLMLLAGWDITRRSLALLGFGMIAGGLLIAYGKWAAAYFREPDPGSVILDEYANTSSAGSIIAFHTANDDFAPGDLGLICSFGAGYSAGTVFVKKR